MKPKLNKKQTEALTVAMSVLSNSIDSRMDDDEGKLKEEKAYEILQEIWAYNIRSNRK